MEETSVGVNPSVSKYCHLACSQGEQQQIPSVDLALPAIKPLPLDDWETLSRSNRLSIKSGIHWQWVPHFGSFYRSLLTAPF